MTDICTANKARQNLHHLIDEVSESHTPVTITGKHNNAVLLSAEDYDALYETAYLCSIPNMREKIRKGLATPIENCIPYEALRDFISLQR